MGDDALREQAVWDEGYATALARVVAWCDVLDRQGHQQGDEWGRGCFWAALEIKRLALKDSAVDEPPQPRPEASAEVTAPPVPLVPGVTHGSPPAPEDVADEHPRQDAPDKGEHGL